MCPVDNMDHLTTIFSCRRKTNRWPMVLFCNMLDVAGVAAFIIWISLNPDWSFEFNDRQGNSLVRNSPMIAYKFAFKPKAV